MITAQATGRIGLILLLCLALWLFRDLPSGFWRADDPALLFHALQSPGLSAFYDPANWQLLSANNLTPWVTLSFKLDLALGGPSPRLFYLHQLLALLALLGAAYGLCRRWLPASAALWALALFLLSASSSAVVELLMTRHYLEGLLFAVLALWAFLLAQAHEGPRARAWALIGALLYALACSAKEIYVPLPLLLLALPGSASLKSHLRLCAPYLAVALAYVPWRGHMLGTWVGGYSAPASLLTLQSMAEIAQAFAGLPRLLWGPAGPAVAAGGALLASLALWRQPRAALWAGGLALGVLAPLAALARFPGLHSADRYLFLLAFAFSVCMAVAWPVAAQGLPPRVRQGAALLLAGLLLALTARQQLALEPGRRALIAEFETQGQFLLTGAPKQGLLPSAGLLAGYWYVNDLCRVQALKGKTCPTRILLGVPLDLPVDSLHRYDPASQRMVELPGPLEPILQRALAVDTTRPLAAQVTLQDGVAQWHFGPYEDGQYLLASPELGNYPLSRQGNLRTALPALRFHLLHRAGDGTVTGSPELRVGVDRPLDWSRPAGP